MTTLWQEFEIWHSSFSWSVFIEQSKMNPFLGLYLLVIIHNSSIIHLKRNIKEARNKSFLSELFLTLKNINTHTTGI